MPSMRFHGGPRGGLERAVCVCVCVCFHGGPCAFFSPSILPCVVSLSSLWLLMLLFMFFFLFPLPGVVGEPRCSKGKPVQWQGGLSCVIDGILKSEDAHV